MITTLKTFFSTMLLPFLLLMVSFSSYAQEDGGVNEETLVLNEKQAELTDTLARLDQLSSLHGHYVIIRDTYYHGENGVRSLSEQWFKDAKSWVKGWYDLLSIVDRAPTLATTDIRSGVQKVLDDQRSRWSNLKTLGEKIKNRQRAAQEEIDKLLPLPENFIAGYGDQIRFFNGELSRLKTAIAETDYAANSAQQREWDDLLQKTQDSVTHKLKLALLKYPQLNDALAQTNYALRAERELEPLVLRVYQRYNALRDHVLSKRVFHGEAALTELRTEAHAALSIIEASSIDPMFKGEPRKTVENYCYDARLMSLQKHVRCIFLVSK